MATRNTSKFIKGTVVFIDMSTEVKKTLEGLAKTALRASGKVIRKKLRENIPMRSKRFKNHIGSWAMINRQTGQPTLQVGFYSWQRVKKKGKLPSRANPHWIEFGVKGHSIPSSGKPGRFMAYDDDVFGFRVSHPGTKATHVLRDTVNNNIAEIRAAQMEYLAELTKKIEEAKAKVYTGNDEDESD